MLAASLATALVEGAFRALFSADIGLLGRSLCTSISRSYHDKKMRVFLATASHLCPEMYCKLSNISIHGRQCCSKSDLPIRKVHYATSTSTSRFEPPLPSQCDNISPGLHNHPIWPPNSSPLSSASPRQPAHPSLPPPPPTDSLSANPSDPSPQPPHRMPHTTKSCAAAESHSAHANPPRRRWWTDRR